MTLAARILALAELTLRNPREAARVLLAEGVPLSARKLGLLFVAVMSVLLASIEIGTTSDPVPPVIAFMMASPLRLAAFEWLMLALSVLMIHRIGRSFGGTGSLADALLITIWVEFLMLGPQVLQLLIGLVSADLAGIIGIGSLAMFLWLITSFIAELHGFRSRPLVFLGMVVASFAAGMVMAILIALILGPKVLLPYV